MAITISELRNLEATCFIAFKAVGSKQSAAVLSCTIVRVLACCYA